METAFQTLRNILTPFGTDGAAHLRDSKALDVILTKQSSHNKKYAAVCASPAVVLASKGLLSKQGDTCYPAPVFREALVDPSDAAVVVQDNLVTSQGPGTSLLFAIQLGEELFGKEAAEKIATEMLVDR